PRRPATRRRHEGSTTSSIPHLPSTAGIRPLFALISTFLLLQCARWPKRRPEASDCFARGGTEPVAGAAGRVGAGRTADRALRRLPTPSHPSRPSPVERTR